jgi:hypothetical protein
MKALAVVPGEYTKPPPVSMVAMPFSTAFLSTGSIALSSTGQYQDQADILADQILDVGYLLGRIESSVGYDDVGDFRMERGLVANVLQTEHDPGVAEIAGRYPNFIWRSLFEFRSVNVLLHLLVLERTIGLAPRGY